MTSTAPWNPCTHVESDAQPKLTTKSGMANGTTTMTAQMRRPGRSVRSTQKATSVPIDRAEEGHDDSQADGVPQQRCGEGPPDQPRDRADPDAARLKDEEHERGEEASGHRAAQREQPEGRVPPPCCDRWCGGRHLGPGDRRDGQPSLHRCSPSRSPPAREPVTASRPASRGRSPATRRRARRSRSGTAAARRKASRAPPCSPPSRSGTRS